MTKTFKKVSAAVLSAGLLTLAVSATLPWVSAGSSIPDPSGWQYAMAQNYDSFTNGTQLDYWQSSNASGATNQHAVGWVPKAGTGADSSQGLYVHTINGGTDNATNEVSINRILGGKTAIGQYTAGDCTSMKFQSFDVTSPTEVWVWVDFTKTTVPERFRFLPFVSDGTNTYGCVPKADQPIYFQTSTGWKASTFKNYTDGATYPSLNGAFISETDLAGFKGYIRMPLTSFDTVSPTDGSAVTVDWTTVEAKSLYTAGNKGTGLQTAFDYQYSTPGDKTTLIDDGFYLDNVMIVGKTAVGGASVSSLLPKANATVQYAMAQNFDSFADGKQLDYWQSVNSVYKVTWNAKAGAGADGSQGLYVHTANGDNNKGADALSINRILGGKTAIGQYTAGDCSSMTFQSFNVTNPTEVWVWVDFTNTKAPERFRFLPFISDGTVKIGCVPKDGAPIYFQTATGWKESAFKTYTDGTADSNLNGVFISETDLASFKGYIRMPLSSFNTVSPVNGSAVTVDWTQFNATSLYTASNMGTGLQTAFDYKYGTQGDKTTLVDDGFYFDNVMILGKTVANPLSVGDLNVPDVTNIEAAPTTTTTTDTTTTTTDTTTTTTGTTTTTTGTTTTTTGTTTTTTGTTTTTTGTTTTTTGTTTTTTGTATTTTGTTTATTTEPTTTTTTVAPDTTTTTGTILPTDTTTIAPVETTAEQTTAATTEASPSPKTGEPVAIGAFALLALASGALLVSKKKK